MIADRYILGTHIGVGSTATVYRAWDTARSTTVAVKLYVDGCDLDALSRQRRELRAMTHVRHHGLVRLHSGGIDRGRPYLICELVDGEPLTARLARTPLDASETHRIGADIAAGLAHLHARGVIHRDVKPANILLCRHTGRARLTDFGIARVLGHCSLTQTGTILGTAAYLAPEQAAGEPVGTAADIYALGLVLLESLTGLREYPGTPIESAVARLHRRPHVPDTLPEPLRTTLWRATRTRAHDRLTGADLAAALVTRHHATSVPAARSGQCNQRSAPSHDNG